MKNILLIISLLTISLSYAQNDNKGTYFKLFKITHINVTKFASKSTLIDVESRNYKTNEIRNYNLELLNGYYLTNKSSIGVGIGFSKIKDEPNINTMPIYLDYRVYLHDTSHSPFVYVDYGKLIKIWDTFNKGWLFNIGIGYKYKSTKKHQFVTSLSYNHKGISLSDNSYKNSNYNYKIGGFGLNIGLIF